MSNNIKENDSSFGKPLFNRRSTVAAAILIGIGLAGLIDIIIFHEILQWHHTASHKIAPNTMESLQMNIAYDGLFLAFSLIMTIAGIILLWHAFGSNSNKNSVFSKGPFVGLVLIGFGGFNTIEGIINHHILEMHHVVEVANPLVFDLTFLVAGGLAFLIAGGILLRTHKAQLKPMT